MARVGDEIEPYVESRYPGPGAVRLYRREPLAVAFTERFNILVPVNRTPSPAEETNQILEWVLAVEKVGGGMGYERLSQTAADWVVAHRGVEPTPRPPRHPVVLDAVVFHTGERQASSIDPLIVRYEAMMDRPGGCTNPGDGLHPSQVLLHEPYDPGAPEDVTPRWEADQELRVNLRQKNAPFVDRTAFETPDATAFTKAAAQRLARRVALGRGSDARLCRSAPAAAQYAVFGETDWRHVQIETIVDPAGAEAGVAVAVAATQSVEALLSSTGTLRIIERNGATIRNLAATINVGTPGAVTLEVTVYDDRIRAKVGEQSIEGALGTIREGRLALVSRGGGRFLRLLVTGLDAWRFHAHTSRYDDFPAHIESFDGVLGVLKPGDVPAARDRRRPALANRTRDPQVMTERDVEARQRLFETWTTALGLPLREIRAFSLTRWIEETHVAPRLESDEPLPFSNDVTLALSKRIKVPTFPHPTPPPIVGTAAAIPDLELDDARIVAPTLPARARAARRILRAIAVERGRVEVEAFEIDRSRRESLLANLYHRKSRVAARTGCASTGRSRGGRRSERSSPPNHSATWTLHLVAARDDDPDQRRRDSCIDRAVGPGRWPQAAIACSSGSTGPRWRAAAPDATSNYRQVATLPFTLP